MAIRRLTALDNSDEAIYRPYLNTGTPLDMVNGKFVSTTQGTYGLSGGLGLTTAFIADTNKYKSAMLNSCAIGAMARFPESHYFDNDTEYSTVDKDRLANMSDLYKEDETLRHDHLEDLKSRIHIYDQTTKEAESLDAWFDKIKQIRDDKITHYKDFEVESELLDPDTLKPYRMLIPTFVGIDSWTQANVRQLNIKNEEHDSDTEMKEQRTIHLEEGWQKNRLMRQLPGICAKGGIYCLLTGHIGKKMSMDGRPVKKDLTYMKQDETAKSMGPMFNFLMSSIIQITNTSPIVNSSDRNITDYPSSISHVSNTELQEVIMTLVRCKNAPSGTQTQVVASQRQGLLHGLSYYHFLRNNKYFGLGNPRSVRNPLIPDIDLGRTKIFDTIQDYKTSRALELIYQLFVIQNYWTVFNQPINYNTTIDEFAKQLTNSSYAMDDILNSRGWWTYKNAPGITRLHMTLPDIICIINGSYKPKFLNVGTPKIK